MRRVDRALFGDRRPSVLMDEPFAGRSNEIRRLQAYDDLLSLWHAQRLTGIFVISPKRLRVG